MKNAISQIVAFTLGLIIGSLSVVSVAVLGGIAIGYDIKKSTEEKKKPTNFRQDIHRFPDGLTPEEALKQAKTRQSTGKDN